MPSCSSRATRGATYVARRVECGTQFEAEHADKRLCRNCGTPAGRVIETIDTAIDANQGLTRVG